MHDISRQKPDASALPKPGQGVTAVVLAGNRPGGDPLAKAAGVGTKALVPIGGQPMVCHVVRTLLDRPEVGRILLLAQAPEQILAYPAAAWMVDEPRLETRVSTDGISQSLLDLMDGEEPLPLLVTTADNVLLTGDMLRDFVQGAQGCDLAVAMVERRVLLARYPQSRRTWLKFRGGWWSGANLFWLGTLEARRGVAFWRSVEQDRKKGRRIVGAFGPLLLAGALLRILTLPQALERAGRRLGLNARLIAMRQAEACIDADKPEDIVLIDQILAAR